MSTPKHSRALDAELETLLCGVCDGTLSEEDWKQLRIRLASDADARRAYMEYLDAESALAEPNIDAFVSHLRPAPMRPAARAESARYSRRWLVLPVVASVLFIAGLFYFNWLSPTEAARIDQLSGDVTIFRGETSVTGPAAGQTLRDGDVVVTQVGRAMVLLRDGSRLQLSEQTQVELGGNDQSGWVLSLAEGQLQTMVPHKLPVAMQVRTPQALVSVTGTEFRVTTTPTGGASVETTSGKVNVSRASSNEAVEVPAGYFTVVAENAEDFVPRPVPTIGVLPLPEIAIPFLRAIAFSPSGDLLTMTDAKVVNHDPQGERPAETLIEWPNQQFAAGAFAHNGMALLRAHFKATLFDAVTGERRADLSDVGRVKWRYAFSADGSTIVAGQMVSGPPNIARIWDVASNSVLTDVPAGAMQNFAMSPRGQFVALSIQQKTGSESPYRFEIWKIRGATEKVTEYMSPSAIVAAAFAPDETYLLVSDGSSLLRFATLSNAIDTLPLSMGSQIRALSFSPSGHWLAMASDLGDLKIWDARLQRTVAELKGGGVPVTSLQFSHDASLLAAAQEGGTVKLWRLHVDTKVP